MRAMASLPSVLRGARIHMVGIKGTGMTALAEILVSHHADLSGSDTDERFYTDEILNQLPVLVCEGFSPANLPQGTELVVYSAAYDPQTHPELVAAAARGIPAMTYSEVLGALSTRAPSVAVAGVHGKTTTTAMIARAVQHADRPGTVVAGSALANLHGRCTYTGGDAFFVAEACEYRRNFLSFSPHILVLTSIEADHLDYFRDQEDLHTAFGELSDRMPNGGVLLWCADDAGASRLAREVGDRRGTAIRRIAYGRQAAGRYAVTGMVSRPGRQQFTLSGFPEPFTLQVPGVHNVLNAVAAIAVMELLPGVAGPDVQAVEVSVLRSALAGFTGTRRRSEVIGEVGGVLVIDDYGHHPTAITTTLAGLRAFYPGRRLVLDFMSHTYTRTKSLLREFAESLACADELVLHRIYASARETDPGDITGEDLATAVRHANPNLRVHYVSQPEEALKPVLEIVQPGDLFVTMGAGNNWRLGRMVLDALSTHATGSGVQQ